MKGNKGLGPGAVFSNANAVNCRWFFVKGAQRAPGSGVPQCAGLWHGGCPRHRQASLWRDFQNSYFSFLFQYFCVPVLTTDPTFQTVRLANPHVLPCSFLGLKCFKLLADPQGKRDFSQVFWEVQVLCLERCWFVCSIRCVGLTHGAASSPLLMFCKSKAGILLKFVQDVVPLAEIESGINPFSMCTY